MKIKRAVWEQLRDAYIVVSKAVEELDDLPANGICECGCSRFRFAEIGYSMDRLMIFDDDWIVVADGWDDVSEEGRATPWVYCYDCDSEYRVPKGVDWQ